MSASVLAEVYAILRQAGKEVAPQTVAAVQGAGEEQPPASKRSAPSSGIIVPREAPTGQ